MSAHEYSKRGLIGGIGLTEVTVYNQRPAPDGLLSGCPHVHAVTDEGYFVLQGKGKVEFHDTTHGFRELELNPGDYVHFPPLVMHRLVSEGNLIILGMMGNAGLAERGEARIYFGQQVDQHQDQFHELMLLPKKEGLDGALKRRDASITAYMKLIALWKKDRASYLVELERFFRTHRESMTPKKIDFTAQVQAAPQTWATQTLARIATLPEKISEEPTVYLNHRGTETALGMCGTLRTILSLEKIS